MEWIPTTSFLLGLATGLIGFCILYGFFQIYIRGPRDTAAASEADKHNAVLKLVVEHVHDGLLVQDIYGHIEWSNPAYSRITGFSAEEIIGRRPQEFMLPDDNQLSESEIANFQYDLDVFKSGFEERIQNRRKNGELFWNELTFAILEGDKLENTKIVLISRDITHHVEHLEDLEEVRKRLKYQAEHDDLTKVANRAKLNTFLEAGLEDARINNRKVGILHLDLDLFKDINDAYGHSAGDAVLVRVAEVLISAVGDLGLVARVGGDEFVVAVPNPENQDVLSTLARKVLKGISAPIVWEHVNLYVSGSIGLTVSKDASITASELVNCADIALYDAKKSEQAQLSWYTPELGYSHRLKRKLAGQRM